mgnify:CR=1 FL=1
MSVTAEEPRNKRDGLTEAVRIAAEAFTAQSWRDINMTEIARAAKCSLSTIYNAFGGKEQFLLYVVSHAVNVKMPDIGASDHDSLRPEVLIWLNLHAHARFLAADQTRQAFANLASLPVEVVEPRRPYFERISRLCDHIGQLTAQAQEAGSMRPGDSRAAGVNMLALSGWRIGLWPLVLGDLAGQPDLEQLTDDAIAPYLTEAGAAHMAQWRSSRP